MEDSGIDSCDARPDEHLLRSSSENSIEEVGVDRPRRPPAKSRRLTPATRKTEFRPAVESLVPLLRLPIPRMRDNTPLVQWESDSSDDIGVTFFPSRVAKTSLTPRDRTHAFGEILSDADGSPDLIVEELTASSSREDEADDLELIVTSPVRGRDDTCCCPVLRPCVIF